jgi:pyruvate-formate lyase-activating enzyme
MSISAIRIGHAHISTSQPPEVDHGMVLELYVVGCRRKCDHCHNKELWDEEIGFEISAHETARRLVREPMASAIAITGGEPLDQPNMVSYIQDLRAIMDFNGDNREILLYTNGLNHIAFHRIVNFVGFVVFGGPLPEEQTLDDQRALGHSIIECENARVRFIQWRKEE